MRKKKKIICAANWKMNKSPEEAVSFMKELTANWGALAKGKDVIIFPTSICWREVREGIRDLPISWGLQNTYYEDSGAFTGEVSMKMAANIGATVALIGHSERRQLFSETNDEVNKKVLAAQKNNLVPMICVGETLNERESKQTNDVVAGQVKAALKNINFSKEIMIAYEPVWAIGTGKVATPEQAQEVHLFIRELLASVKSEKFSLSTPLLYGGSVKPNNAHDLALQTDIDGFLIGGAALEVSSFQKIIDLV